MVGYSVNLRDTRAYYDHDIRFIITVTIIVVLFILILLLRAIVAPLYLIASVVMSYFAAMGLGVIMFQMVLGQELHWSMPGITFIILVAVGADGPVIAQALCGRSGRVLWRQELPREQKRSGLPPRLELIRSGGRDVIACVYGGRLVGFDARTGRQAWPARTLGFERTWQVTGGDGYYRGLAYGGGSLWVGPIFGGVPIESFLTRVDPRTGARRTMLLTHGPPAGLEWSEGYGDLWMENFSDGSLTRLHAATGARRTVLDAAFNPAYGVVEGDVVWVADWSAPQVTRLHAVGRARPRRILLPTGNPLVGVENIAGGAGAIWATMPQAGELWRIDPKTNAATRVRLPYLPTGVTADAKDVWVTVRER